MKRALLCMSALLGLSLGFCTQPREIHASSAVTARARAERESRPVVRVAIEYVVDAALAATNAAKPNGGM